MIKRNVFLALMAFGLIFTSCNDSDDKNDDNDSSKTKKITLSINGLEELGSDFVYEGWIIVGGKPVSTGTFTDVSSGQTFDVDEVKLDSATNFVLSIEPAGETGEDAATPSSTKLVTGAFSGDSAKVSIATVLDSVNVDSLTNVKGKFFLRSPTDEMAGAENNGNDENGIWFGTPGDSLTAGLDLPALQAGWKYEGWVVLDSTALSTGTFTAFDTADDNAGAETSFSGTENAGPPIPGEDFFNNAPEGITFPLDIKGKTVVISIEPSPDNSPAPFLLKPLKGTAGDETAPTTYDLTFDSASFPSGTVTRKQ